LGGKFIKNVHYKQFNKAQLSQTNHTKYISCYNSQLGNRNYEVSVKHGDDRIKLTTPATVDAL